MAAKGKITVLSGGRWLVLLTVIVGTFMGRLDGTIVNLAMPKMIDDFGITVSAAGWIATAYILANAVFVPIWGKLGDTVGRKKIYMLGFAGFIVGSVLAAFAWNFQSMVVFRVIQAVAGSADYPTAMAILAVTFREPKERAQAMGFWSSSFAAAAVFGPLIGGPLVDAFGWRSIFIINLPVGLVGLYLASRYIKESVSDRRALQFDLAGALALGAALASLVLVLDKGNDWEWLSGRSIACYLVTAMFAALFVAIERRAKEPIIDLRMFRIPVFVDTMLNNFVVFMGMMGSMFLLPVFAQVFLGYNATETGVLFMPMAAAMMFASPLGGALIGRVEPRYVLFASTGVSAFGIALFSRLDPKSGVADIILPLFIMAFGMGFGMAQRTSLVTAAVPPEDVGVASSVLALARNIAGAFGIAIFGSILTNAHSTNLLAAASYSALNSRTPTDLAKFLTLISLRAQIDSFGTVYLVAAAVVLVGAVLALRIRLTRQMTVLSEPIE